MKQALMIAICATLFSITSFAKPTVIAHRGASGYLPEHTLEAFILAYSQGADFIEQDIVVSKDGIPVVLHDIHLQTVTNVESQFPHKARKDGQFYALDFTLAELKSLSVHERQNSQGQQVFPNRFKGQSTFKIATFEEQLILLEQLNRQFNKDVGIYPEIKSPKWHRDQGVDISEKVISMLRKYNWDDANKPIFIQCFDFNELSRLKNKLNVRAKLVQLIGENSWNESDTDYDYLKTPKGLTEIANIATGIGPWLPQLIDIPSQTQTALMAEAKKLGLKVHPYTFRKDQLPEGVTSTQALDLIFKVLKADGIFTDFTDVVVNYIEQ